MSLVERIARRFCGHGEREVAVIERRLANARQMQNRLRRLASRQTKRLAKAR